ncbi:hypothetical protein JOC77_003529 [Peribacillus deserti]|uniref:DUF4352 domain-containing protein n=1 Tax=Peribacillus deserti TaxID=673318 RepID=A0ABS2QLN4_9BACI|nr:membrane lipoprotein lipid attachment site-containing protein [Peribacillus deserti]MBM7694085.1 hypothetical protein [Peribacillus deserti]
MKKIIPLLLITALLSACSSEQISNPSAAKAKEKQEQTAQEAPSKEKNRAKSLSDIYVPNPQVTDDTKLLKAGQAIEDEKGEMTLKGINSLNKTINLGSVDMKIKNVKLIHNRPTYSLMDYFHAYTEHYEDFQFVKVEVELVNKTEKTVHFGPVAHINTSNGEKKVFEDDFYIEYLGGKIEPKGSKQGALGFIVEKSSPGLNWIDITTSDVLDEKQKTISKAKNIRIDFN